MHSTSPKSDSARGALWRFSLSVYGRPGVAAACLDLQDRYARDVNLVLFAAWTGAAGRGRLTAGDLATADDAVGPWRRDVIEPLRALRRQVKNAADSASVYEAVKTAELEAEHAAQDRLEALAPAPVPAAMPLDDAFANLALYLGSAEAFAVAAPLRSALADLAAKTG